MPHSPFFFFPLLRMEVYPTVFFQRVDTLWNTVWKGYLSDHYNFNLSNLYLPIIFPTYSHNAYMYKTTPFTNLLTWVLNGHHIGQKNSVKKTVNSVDIPEHEVR